MIPIFNHADESSLSAITEEMEVRQTTEVFLLFSLGSQFDHLIKLMFEKMGVFCLLADPRTVTAGDVSKLNPKGIVLSGGPKSVYDDEKVLFDLEIFDIGIPVLGICLGFQMWAQHIGAKVEPAKNKEFGVHTIHVENSPLFLNCPRKMSVLESHGDRIDCHAPLTIIGVTEHAPVAAGYHKHLYGVQFHPETSETTYGQQIFEDFCFGICGAKDRYPAEDQAKKKIEEIIKTVGDGKVLLAISGGSDSSVVAYLLKKAFGHTTGRVRAVYIKGVDRPDDEEFVHRYFEDEPWLELKIVDATNELVQSLAGKHLMKEKRLAMKGVYQKVLEKEITLYQGEGIHTEVLIAQGTLYTDNAESGHGHAGGAKAVIKVHHNTGISWSARELTPLDDCVKDGAREIGRSIDVPEELLVRHPFPGPGMVVRIEGEVNALSLAVARKVDGIYVEELRKWKDDSAGNLYNSVWQAGAVVTNSIATCTKGDGAVSGAVVCLWAVWSVDGFTARFARLPYEFLDHVSRRITNEVSEVGSVTFRISDKPPATIEWG